MGIERLHEIKYKLLSCVEEQMHDLSIVDAEELGEVIDMIKDIEEAIYYCTVVEAMHESGTDNMIMKNETTTQPMKKTLG